MRLLVIAGWATAILPVYNCRFILILFYLFHDASTTGLPSALVQLYRSEARLKDSLKKFDAWYSGVDRFSFRKNVAYFCGTLSTVSELKSSETAPPWTMLRFGIPSLVR